MLSCRKCARRSRIGRNRCVARLTPPTTRCWSALSFSTSSSQFSQLGQKTGSSWHRATTRGHTRTDEPSEIQNTRRASSLSQMLHYLPALIYQEGQVFFLISTTRESETLNLFWTARSWAKELTMTEAKSEASGYCCRMTVPVLRMSFSLIKNKIVPVCV